MSRSAKAVEQRLRGLRETAGSAPPGASPTRSQTVAQTPLGEEVVHQQGGLAGRRRALERRRRDADDDSSALEPVEHVARSERRRRRCRTRARPRRARESRRVEVGTERDDEDVGVERAVVGLDPLGRRDRSPDRRCTNRTPGLHDRGRGDDGAPAPSRPNITSSFENPNTNPSLLSISTTSTSSPNSSDNRVASSSPPNPAPSTTTRFIVPPHLAPVQEA